MKRKCWALEITLRGRKRFLSYNIENIPELYASRERARGDARTLEAKLNPKPVYVTVMT